MCVCWCSSAADGGCDAQIFTCKQTLMCWWRCVGVDSFKSVKSLPLSFTLVRNKIAIVGKTRWLISFYSSKDARLDIVVTTVGECSCYLIGQWRHWVSRGLPWRVCEGGSHPWPPHGTPPSFLYLINQSTRTLSVIRTLMCQSIYTPKEFKLRPKSLTRLRRRAIPPLVLKWTHRLWLFVWNPHWPQRSCLFVFCRSQRVSVTLMAPSLRSAARRPASVNAKKTWLEESVILAW